MSGNTADYTDTGLTEGTSYQYKVAAYNDGGMTAFTSIAQSDTFCVAPTDLVATASTAGSVSLSWTDHSNGAIGYAVAVSADGGETFNAATTSLSDSASAYTVTGLTEGSAYQFQVYAYNDAGPSDNSNTLAATTAPAAPTLQSATVQSDGTHIIWQNNSTGATGFTVSRSSDGGSTFGQSWLVDLSQTGYVDNTGLANTHYTYQVIATNAGGVSTPSAHQTVLTLPSAITTVTASSPTSSSAVVSWTPDAQGAGGYVVERSTDGNAWLTIGTPGSLSSTYTDTTAAAGATYTYRVTATNATGASASVASSPVAVLTAAPTGLAASTITASSVALTWNDVTGETGFQVQRSTDSETWTTLTTTPSGQAHYTDSTANEATSYFYRLAGVNGSGTGDFAAAISTLTLPATPTGLITTPVSAGEVDLSWTNHSAGTTGYTILRATNAGAYTQLATGLSGTASSYHDTTPSGGTTYSYQVIAYNNAGNSVAATQSALTVPAQTQDVHAVAASASEIDLTWSAMTGAAHYVINRSTDNSVWTPVATVGANVLSYSDLSLTEGTHYYYTVTGTNSSGAGVAAEDSTFTLPAAVTTLQVTSATATTVNLGWTDVSQGATAYNIYRSSDAGQTFALLTTIHNGSATSYSDTASEATAYTYRVAPVDAAGEGIAADVSIITIPQTPTLASATPISAGEIDLAWTNHSAHATGFTVQRTVFGQNSWTTLSSSLASSASSYADTSVLSATQYQYKVTANGAGGSSADSATLAALTYPAAVTTLAVNASSTNEIDLTWTQVSGAATYKVLHSTDNVTFTNIATLDGALSSYQDTNNGSNLNEATRYYYQVVAHNLTGDSTAGTVAYTSTLALSPTALATAVVSNHEVDLSWVNHSAGNTGVGIERSTNNSTWTLLTVSSASATSYHDMTASGGTSYYYRVSAINEAGTNYMADHASVTALTLPDAPVLSTTPLTDGTVSLNWTVPTGASTFTVQRSVDSTNWSDVATAISGHSSIDSSLTGNAMYQYRVLATNATGDGAYSSIVSALTVPNAPSGLSASSPSSSEIDLSWSGDAGVTFGIYRQTNNAGLYVKLANVTGATTYHDLSAVAGVNYAYEVLATNASGQSVTPTLVGLVTTLPTVPTGFTPSVISTSEVDLSWSASTGAASYSISRSADGGSSFTVLTVSPLSSATLSYHDTVASAGTSYTYKVTATNTAGSQSTTTTALTYPAAPSGLTVNVTDNHTLAVQWNATTSAASYTVQRSADGVSGWTNVSGISGTAVNDTVAGGSTFTYRVRATNATGDSAWSTGTAVTTVPDATTNVSASATSDTAVHVTWTLSSGATHYVVQRSVDSGSNWTDASGSLSSLATSFNDTGLAELTSYMYRVMASNSAGTSAAGVTSSTVTQPTAPSNLQPSSISATQVVLTWTDNTAGHAGFDVSRSTDGGETWSVIGNPVAGVTTFTDSQVNPGSTYLYRVVADNGSVVSAPTAPYSVLTLADAPANVIGTPISATEVDVAWSAAASATSYNIYRSVNGAAFAQLATGVVETSYHDMSALGGTMYNYEVFAVNDTGTGVAGTSSSVTTIPAAQTDFAATPSGPTQVNLTWTDVAGASTYTIFRSTDGTNFTALTLPALAGNVDAYSDTTAAPATSYTYKIVGTNSTGASVATTASALTVPSVVGGLNTTLVSDTEIDLSWTADTGTISGYRVFRSTNGGTTFSQIGSDLASSTLTFNDTGRTSATDYVYEVRAFNTTGQSGASDTNVITTLPATPDTFAATPQSATEVDLTWTDVSGADSYTIKRSTGDSYTTITDPAISPGVGSYHDMTAEPGTRYSYEIVATNSTGDSVPTIQSALTVPAGVNGLTATVNGTSEIDLAWTADAGVVTHYRVMESTGGAYSQVGSDLAADATSLNVTGLTAATAYQFEVLAVNASGVSDVASGFTGSYWANTQTRPDLIPLDTPPTFQQIDQTINMGGDTYGNIPAQLALPGAPMDSERTILSPSGTVRSGPNTASNTRSMRPAMMEFACSSMEWLLAPITLPPLGGKPRMPMLCLTPLSQDSLTTSKCNTSRAEADGTPAWNGAATPRPKNLFIPMARWAATTVPTTPGSFTAAGVSSSEVDLSWTDVTGATAYEVDRQNPDSTWTTLSNSLPDNAISYPDVSLDAGSSYTYRVKALDAGGASVATSSQTVATRPDVVGSFQATTVGAHEIDLSWDAAVGATGYRILRSTGGAFSQLTTTTTPGYANTALPEGTAYTYEIIAYNTSGDGLATSDQAATTLLISPDVASSSVSATGLTVTWTDHSAGETGYMLEQLIAGTWNDIVDNAALSGTGTTDSQVLTGLTEATDYTFRVTALSGSTFDSTPAVLYVSTAPNDPTALTATPASTTRVDLAWTNNSASAAGQHIERSLDAGSQWTLLTNVAGDATTYTDTTATEATAYLYRVAAYKSTSFSGYATSASVTTLPLAPTALAASAVSPTEIDLSWTNNSAHATAYRVYSSSDGVTFAQLGSDLGSNAVSYHDMSAAENATTYYRVVAVDAGGESVVSVTGSANATTPLAAPTGVTAATTTSVASGDKTINLAWTNTSGVASNVKVERSGDGGNTWVPLTTLASNATSYSDDTALENASYTYRVYAYAAGNSVASSHAASNSIRTLLSRPTDLAVSSPTSSSVELTWTDVSSAATSYRIERSTDGTTFADVGGTVSGSTNTYTDTARTEGTQYWYRVRAVTVGGNTSNSSTVQDLYTLPATPATLAASPFSTTEVDLTWTDISTHATGYTVERSTDAGLNWATVTSALNGSATNYSDTGLTEATDYEYRVFATGAGGNSADSNTPTTATLPNTPTGVGATGNSATSVTVAWTDNSSGETFYEVQRSTGGAWTTLTSTLAANTTSYTDTTAVEATAYQYRVRGNRNGTESAYSSIATVTTVPAAPSGVNVTSSTSSRVTLGWTDNSSGETGFRVLRSTDGGTTWAQSGTPGANSTTFSDNSITEGIAYTYLVQAYNTAGNSANSNITTANIVPAAPTGLATTSVTAGSVALTWTNHSAHQTGFYVERSTDGGTTWTQLADVTGGATVYTDTTTEASSYQYRVRAHGTTGNSNYSSSIAVNTPVAARLCSLPRRFPRRKLTLSGRTIPVPRAGSRCNAPRMEGQRGAARLHWGPILSATRTPG